MKQLVFITSIDEQHILDNKGYENHILGYLIQTIEVLSLSLDMKVTLMFNTKHYKVLKQMQFFKDLKKTLKLFNVKVKKLKKTKHTIFVADDYTIQADIYHLMPLEHSIETLITQIQSRL